MGGISDSGLLTCPRDQVATRLTCPDCRTPICPKCFVRTPVGLKCPTCAAPVGGAVGRGRRRGRLGLAGGVVLLLIVAGAWALLGRSGGRKAADDIDVNIAPSVTSAVEGMVVGTGRAPDGASWSLGARRDERGRICLRLNLTGGRRPATESCDATPGTRPFGPVHTRASFQGGRALSQSWGVVSSRAARVQAITEDGTTSDVEILGGGADLGVEFYVSYVDRLVAVTFVAFGPNGEELGRVDPPPIPPPPGR